MSTLPSTALAFHLESLAQLLSEQHNASGDYNSTTQVHNHSLADIDNVRHALEEQDRILNKDGMADSHSESDEQSASGNNSDESIEGWYTATDKQRWEQLHRNIDALIDDQTISGKISITPLHLSPRYALYDSLTTRFVEGSRNNLPCIVSIYV